MTYQQALTLLYEQLPMYQREGKRAYKADLSNTIALLDFLDNPQDSYPSIHIAGTNGKGTCAHTLAAILQLAGKKTGLYTSPHLKNFTERIKINGQEVEKDFVASFVDKVETVIQEIRPSFFELTVAMAFEYFSKTAVDVAVVETGLGGRLDSTNVLASPILSVITTIGFDHVDLLGNTLELIANEKAGIIKKQRPVVVGSYDVQTFPVFKKKAEENQSKLILSSQKAIANREELTYQKRLNYETIRASTEELRKQGFKISEAHFQEGIRNAENITGLKGRFQRLSEFPLIVADISHNTEGIKELMKAINGILLARKNSTLHVLFGTVQDKDLNPILAVLPKTCQLYITTSTVPRAKPVEQVLDHCKSLGIQVAGNFENVNQGIALLKKKMKKEDVLIITGSTFLVAEVDDL
ncbi:MAG: folylpolyglutamate synthase/dihydrofolate synthase family protein [Bacteroidota bacterium]